MSEYRSITALDQLLDDLVVGEARRRQLSMVRGELLRALARGALPVPARRSLRRLLEEDSLGPYLRLAESGALRTRLVDGKRPPTSAATNEIRRQVLDVLREALGLPALQLGGGALPLQPTPQFGDLAALRRQLDQDLAGHMSPGQARLTAVLGLVLDAAPRSGELVELRLDDLAAGIAAVYIERRPQRGGGDQDGEGSWYELSPLTRAALGRWLPVRAELAQHAHGTSRLWVSLWHNHDGDPGREGATLNRPPGMPLEENGLITSYRRGRARYGLAGLLPPKLEQLRRAVIAETPPVATETAESS
ncbi:hypothetical protein [Streptomyces rugosispiralis]|uniref:Uncharacterized protein n=1 Tax=Streptomyces rugosispiralis TaxID=2967341 RepID=A0ABT1VCF9_9ACTN|nr:hypothetical protein [Streptomyces rugosispiralis]MCQ8194653.1 hypothetical protein [Streptomyces rugosispiralis]